MTADPRLKAERKRRAMALGVPPCGLVVALMVLVVAAPVGARPADSQAPDTAVAEAPAGDDAAAGGVLGLGPENAGTALRFLAVVTVVGVVPSIVLLATCFPRILIVLSFLRRALGTHELPPQSVVGGLALLLTALVMLPVARRVHDEAWVPLRDGRVETVEAALGLAEAPVKEFLLEHTLRRDLALMVELADASDEGAKRKRGPDAGSRTTTVPPAVPPAGSVAAAPVLVDDLPFLVVLPAFVLSELKIAFQIGFLILLPFVVIDLAVSAVLLSMGMFMLPPVLVSLPLKILVFVLVDGWHLVVGQLLRGFTG